jgi:uncharacterized protein (DUF4213/DUF364 family)
LTCLQVENLLQKCVDAKKKLKMHTNNLEMNLLNDVLTTLPEGRVVNVNIGLHWTAVVVEVGGQQRCGLASTLHNEHSHGAADIPMAGELENFSGLALADFIRADQTLLASVGMAAINALLPHDPKAWVDLNAEEVIARHGAGKSVVLVGHFPFIPRLQERVGELAVLERNPQPGDLPTTHAHALIPGADVVAITAMTLINHSLQALLELCNSQAKVILLGPTTPLSPILFDYGIDLLCGSIVTEISPVLLAVAQGANFRQVHHAGVRLVSIARPQET